MTNLKNFVFTFSFFHIFEKFLFYSFHIFSRFISLFSHNVHNDDDASEPSLSSPFVLFLVILCLSFFFYPRPLFPPILSHPLLSRPLPLPLFPFLSSPLLSFHLLSSSFLLFSSLLFINLVATLLIHDVLIFLINHYAHCFTRKPSGLNFLRHLVLPVSYRPLCLYHPSQQGSNGYLIKKNISHKYRVDCQD